LLTIKIQSVLNGKQKYENNTKGEEAQCRFLSWADIFLHFFIMEYCLHFHQDTNNFWNC